MKQKIQDQSPVPASWVLGPALATIVWTVSGSGISELRAGLVLMVAVTGLGALSTALGSPEDQCWCAGCSSSGSSGGT